MFDRILVLAPHTDDGEFGCGAAMSKWISEGKKLFYAAFSSAEKSVPKGLPKDILRKEVKAATAVLGIPPEHLIIFKYPVREFPAFRQEILEDMIRLASDIKPNIVLLPSANDTHQDHQVVAQEGFRAFKKTSMIGYEVPWNNLSFTTNMFVRLERSHVLAKISALKCYRSQSHRAYATEEFVWDLARVRGTQIGARYAEVFEVIRWVM